MSKPHLLIIFILLISLSGCEFMSFDEHETPSYEGSLTFSEVNKKADWKNRFDFEAVSYDDKLWILGGYNPGEIKNDPYYEDVWSSENGLDWTLLTDNAPWHGRRGHRVVVFDDGNGEAMYLIGGYSENEETGYRQYNNDVWKSTDGINWTELLATCDTTDRLNPHTWYPRMGHAVVTANHEGNNYIYIIGGRTQFPDLIGKANQGYFNDVWRSEDGIHWDSLNNEDFGIRAGHAACVNPNTGRIYIQGGLHGYNYERGENAYHPSNEWSWVWYSDDGIHWTADANEESEFPQYVFFRTNHDMLYYEDKIWVFSGATDNPEHYYFTFSPHIDIWNMDMSNGNWTIETGSPYYGRTGYASAVHNGKIWILGGNTSNIGQNNDVWTAEL